MLRPGWDEEELSLELGPNEETGTEQESDPSKATQLPGPDLAQVSCCTEERRGGREKPLGVHG